MKRCRLCLSDLKTENVLPKDGVDFKKLMGEIEFEIVSEALRRTRGNQAKAGRLLRLPPHAFRYLVEKHDLKDQLYQKPAEPEAFED